MSKNARENEGVVKLVPGGDSRLAHLSDSELLAATRALAGRSNQLFAALLAHLAEVEARGLHRTRACASLYTYCIYELRFSEDAAARRAGAAKLVKRFPLLLRAIADGELHLTGLLMLGPHLTPENVVEVLGRAKFRTKKELAKLVRELHPLPLVPDAIEPLGLEARPLRNPTWQEFLSSFAPAVRELPPGERPGDWAHDAPPFCDADGAQDAKLGHDAEGAYDVRSGHDLDEANDHDRAPSPPAPARVEPWQRTALPPVTGPQQYQMQFTASEEHVQLVERAKALLARRSPGKSLGELHLEAMRLLVHALETQRFGAAAHPRTGGCPPDDTASPTRASGVVEDDSAPVPPPANGAPPISGDAASEPRQRGRHIPASVRRAVFARDAGRCSYVDERGVRCRETHGLELHHRTPFGEGGPHTVANLTLHCRAHNGLAAEHDFGPEWMAQMCEPWRHESLRAIQRLERCAATD